MVSHALLPYHIKNRICQDFPVVQWLRLCLPMQGVRVWSLLGKLDPTCLGAKIKKKQDIKQKDYCNKFNKDFKNGKKKRILVEAIILLPWIWHSVRKQFLAHGSSTSLPPLLGLGRKASPLFLPVLHPVTSNNQTIGLDNNSISTL